MAAAPYPCRAGSSAPSPPDTLGPPLPSVALPPLVPATFRQRISRFSAIVELAGEPTLVCVRNSSRMRELLFDGAEVWLRPGPGAHRKTAHDIVLAGPEQRLVVVDAHLANRVAERWLQSSGGAALGAGGAALAREVGYLDSRIDFRLQAADGPLWVEVKSVSLCRGGVAYFPDAPTTRGVRHLGHLLGLARSGGRAAVLFIILRPDVSALRPEAGDPAFSRALAEAVLGGVAARALRCRVTLDRVAVLDEVPVLLE